MIESLYEFYKSETYPLKDSELNEDEGNFVYLVQSPSTSLYKIGYSRNIIQRLRNLITQSGDDLQLLMGIELGGCDERPAILESFLHKFFSHKRKMGEWFDLSLRDLVQIRYAFYLIEGSDCIGLKMNEGCPYVENLEQWKQRRRKSRHTALTRTDC